MNVSKKLDNTLLTDTITVGQYKIKKHFKYLNTIVTQIHRCQMEIRQRIKIGNKCFYALNNLLGSRILSKNVKIQLHMTIIRPVGKYGSQYWSLRKIEEDRLRIFEKRVL